jgi:hypothetical protein
MVYHIYCDESRQSKDRYMVLGGIILPVKHVQEFYDTVHNFRIEQKMFVELKWTKVSDRKLDQYERFIDYFFALNDTDKLYYQLLLHCFGKIYCRKGEDDRFIVHLDYRTTTYSLNTLKIVLNRGMQKKFEIDSNPFVSIEPRNSKKSELIQMNDILLGAIGFQKNGYDLLSGARKAKKKLSQYIATGAGLKDLKNNTLWGRVQFTIWNFKLQ